MSPYQIDFALYLIERGIDLLPSILLAVLIMKISKLNRLLAPPRRPPKPPKF